MISIDLQQNTKPDGGTIESYYFLNPPHIPKRTKLHRVVIPLAPFDSQIEYEEQPVETEITIDWIVNEEILNSEVQLSSDTESLMEASVYLGSVHNMCTVRSLHLAMPVNGQVYCRGNFLIEFEKEEIARNEKFEFETTLEIL